MNGLAVGMRMAACGVAVVFTLLAGKAASAPVFAPMQAPAALGSTLGGSATSAFAPVHAPSADNGWPFPQWRFRPVTHQPFPPPMPYRAAPWVMRQLPVALAGPVRPMAMPAPMRLPGHPAVAGAPAFARQYAWQPRTPRDEMPQDARPVWGAAVPLPPTVAWADGNRYRFRPLPIPATPRYAARPRWAMPPPWHWQPYAVPALAAAPELMWPAPPPSVIAHAPVWPPSPPSVASAWHPLSPMPGAGHPYRFRPDQRLGPAVVRLPAVPRQSADLAWTGGTAEIGPYGSPWGHGHDPAFAAPARVQAYN